ncbi:MAG: S9 family peptidase [Flavobacteriales bacterium]|jgi:prolyl oligopeptidase|nr:S9 family peptidase [Flavobacteriales bacterium]MBK7247780.1 S9 family peptidase [Flavobacteriales bacterium]MBK9597154.1 S9 family peptidase [Flavobacteriales bacterium]QQS73051.1 MAG: S9 family peptidase [Flavobacteriales bacterium]HQV38156.1 prolyl oligopeptidase family serine peptidase [Flavobacteriales bacterium]
MHKTLPIAVLLLASCGTSSEPAKKPMQKIAYPETRKDTTVVDDFFGTQVADPYRWLENDTSAETADWVKRENTVTQAYLADIPFRDAIAKRYEDILNFPKEGAPWKVGNLFFSTKNSGLQNQGVIHVRTGLDGEDKVFIDPNAVDPAGTTSIGLMGASKDDRYMAVSVQKAGSDWQDITLWDLKTMTPMADTLYWAKFSGVAWYKDGFFYSRFPEPKKGTELSAASQYQKVYYHKLGDPQAKDALVWKNDDEPNLYVGVNTTEGEEFATLYIATGTDGFEQYFFDLRKGVIPTPATQWTPLQQGFEQKTSIIAYEPKSGKLLATTDVDAPKYRLVAVDPANPAKENWKDVIPQKDDLLEGVNTGGGKLFASYLKDATTRIYRYAADGSGEQEVKLPGLGSAGGFGGKREDTYSFYSFTSFTDPGSIFKYDYATGKSELYYRPELKFNPDEYETEQDFYTSKDGTKVPMFIVHKKGVEKSGKNPALLYAYGGFNISLSPSFSTSRMILLEQGGVFALANLRGGGEYGEAWHKAGMKEKKQNVFDDFIAAAEYLIAQKWTDKDHLAIEGGSNGGLLVGAVMTQRPDLCAVAFPHVGVMDMLRYQKFTAGFGWVPEFGDADNSKEEFQYLHAYSPLHNIKPANYPATLVFTADHDDRVVPAHSFKFISTLQVAQEGNAPVLIRVDTNAGHGAGKPTSKIIQEEADKWAFFFNNIGVTPEYRAAAKAK